MYNKLSKMIDELSNYHRDRNNLFEYYIKKRLEQSFEIYKKELEQSLSYLNNRKVQTNIMKKINRKKRK